MSRELEAVRAAITDIDGKLEATKRAIDAAVLVSEESRLKADMFSLDARRETLRREEQRLLDQADEQLKQHEIAQRAFWFQRLNTSLAIAHGAGFAAVASHLFDPNTTPTSAGLSLPAMATFGLGALVAGAIPLPLAYEKRQAATWLMVIAAGLFVLAVGLATYGAALKAFDRVWIWQP